MPTTVAGASSSVSVRPMIARIGAEAAPPEPVAQQHGERAAGQVLVRGEPAPPDRRGAQHAGGGGRHESDAKPLGRAVAGQAHRAVGKGGEPGERPRPLAQVPVLGHAQLRQRLLGAVSPQHHQPVRLGVGQRTEQHAVGDAEDRRVGPDAEGQRHHRDEGEPGPLPQPAKGIAQVLQQPVHSDLSEDIGSTLSARRAGM